MRRIIVELAMFVKDGAPPGRRAKPTGHNRPDMKVQLVQSFVERTAAAAAVGTVPQRTLR
ncbi:UNVERIFIED_ORG: hypothetical protein ABIC54_003512 [Burkholderia sp. 1263]